MILVYGLAVAGAATVRALQRRGVDVVAADDRVDEQRTRRSAAELDVELVGGAGRGAPRRARRRLRASSCRRRACPRPTRSSPPPAPAGRPVRSELELAYRWEQERPGGPRPMLAVTGTDGKTTTTLWAVEMLAAGGVRAVAAGNTDVPLVAALDLDVDAFVVECTSFRLAWTEQFRGDAAAWLNLAPDHLNWHASMATYEAAKARIFSQQRAGDVAIGFADDPVVMAHLRAAPGAPPHVRPPPAPTTTSSGGDGWSGPQGALGDVAVAAPGAAPRPHQRPRRRRPRAREPASPAPTPSPPGWRRSSARRTASSWSATTAACAGTTTPRRRRRTPRQWRSGPSTTSC